MYRKKASETEDEAGGRERKLTEATRTEGPPGARPYRTSQFSVKWGFVLKTVGKH